MTGRVNFSPEARQQLHLMDDWITEMASPDTSRRFMSVITVLGVFHGGQDWEATLGKDPRP